MYAYIMYIFCEVEKLFSARTSSPRNAFIENNFKFIIILNML